LPSEEDSPSNSAGVLALEEQALGLAILETEDLAVTTDVQLALNMASAHVPINRLTTAAPLAFQTFGAPLWNSKRWCAAVRRGSGDGTHLAGVDLLAAEGIVVGTHVGGGDAVPVG
jgi:hypothetical protein